MNWDLYLNTLPLFQSKGLKKKESIIEKVQGQFKKM
jgi:hypothetical protein